MDETPTHVANAASHLGVEIERLLPGGWQQGAWVVRKNNRHAVLKVHTDELDRVEEARAWVDRGVAAGWPTPRWLDVGRLDETVYVLTEFIDGQRPDAMTERVIDGFTAAFEVQRSISAETSSIWGAWDSWVNQVVFDDGPGLRSRITGVFPRAEEIIALVDGIAANARPISGSDLVHGNCNLNNVVDDGTTLWLVDVSSLGSGPVEYDAAETLLVSQDQDVGRLWHWVENTCSVETLAVCLASDALSMADAFARLGYLHMAEARAPSMVRNLERARAFLG